MAETIHASEPRAAVWTDVEVVLDDMLARLKTDDRNVILLRFYDQCEMPEIAKTLGVSEEAARMRISRAVGKLRGWLAREGIGISASALLTWIAGPASQHAPLAAATDIAAHVFNPSIGSNTILISKGVMKTMLLLKLKAAATVLVDTAGRPVANATVSIIQYVNFARNGREESSFVPAYGSLGRTQSNSIGLFTVGGAHIQYMKMKDTSELDCSVMVDTRDAIGFGDLHQGGDNTVTLRQDP